MAKSEKTITRSAWPLAALGVLIAVVYAPAFLWMWDRWFARDSYYSHGLLIPFVSAYLIWQKREALKKTLWQASRWGLALFWTAIALQIVGALFRVYFTSGFSLIMVLAALVWYFCGASVLRLLLFPIGFLVFMVPLPEVIIVNLSFRLKMLAANIAVAALHGLGIFCIQQGSTIAMRHANIVVEDVCSGLRSLITLMALGSLFAYTMKSTFLKRMALFLSAVPIAVLANVLRIVFLACVTEVWGTKVGSGWVHEFSGFLVFLGAFGLLYVVQKTME